MDNFYIITNSDKDENLEFSGQIEEYLHKNGCRCMVQQAERKKEGAYHYTNPDLIPEDTQDRFTDRALRSLFEMKKILDISLRSFDRGKRRIFVM